MMKFTYLALKELEKTVTLTEGMEVAYVYTYEPIWIIAGFSPGIKSDFSCWLKANKLSLNVAKTGKW